jgi:uridine kinase
MQIIGIGGGSGSGKTTVCQALQASRPEMFQVLSIDNYQRAKTDPAMPRLHGMINWDHPQAILWQRLRSELQTLKSGRAIQTTIWAGRSVNGQRQPASNGGSSNAMAAKRNL